MMLARTPYANSDSMYCGESKGYASYIIDASRQSSVLFIPPTPELL
jgi:hypothetical protein